MLYVIEVILLAISLSMDAFSLSTVLSTINIIKEKEFKYVLFVGLFHFLMPILGYFIKCNINKVMYIPTKELFTIVMIILIIGIIFDKERNITNKLINPLIFAFTVSIDSLVIGLSLSKLIIFSAFMFSIVSIIFTLIGFLIGNKINRISSKKSKMISIIILILVLIFKLM